MAKTFRKKINRGTLKRKPSYSIVSFQKEITVVFFEILLMVKLYHWKTYSYSTHKATDELYSSLNSNFDKFIEDGTLYHIDTSNGVMILIDRRHEPYLLGLVVDHVRNGLNEGFEFSNPNERDRCGCGESFRV
jgi:hypothetical protein